MSLFKLGHERLVQELLKIGATAPDEDIDDMDIFVAVRSGKFIHLLFNGISFI